MAHYVNCIYCKKRVDRDKVSTVQVSARRYAHKECAENYENNKSQEEKDIEALEKYIMKLFNEDYVNARVRKQIKEYREQYQYTYSGMLKTLVYWYEIKGNSTEKANGGIACNPSWLIAGLIPHIITTNNDNKMAESFICMARP